MTSTRTRGRGVVGGPAADVYCTYRDGAGSSSARVKAAGWRRLVPLDGTAGPHAALNDQLTAAYDGDVDVMSLATSIDRRPTRLDTDRHVCN